MQFRLPNFAAGLAACALATFAPAALADNFIDDTSTPGVVFVNGTAGSDLILMGTLCDGSIGAIRFSGCSVDVGIIAAGLIPTTPIVILGGDGSDVIDTFCVDALATLQIEGGNGDDTIFDGAGNSLILGGDGNDYVSAGDGNDTIFGGKGFKDRLSGGNGDDSISDEDGVAAAQGGKGMDYIFVNFDALWDDDSNATNTRKSIGAIAGGADDDTVEIVVNGTPIKFGVDGDGGAGTPGTFDQLILTGSAGTGSIYPNFEFGVP